MKKKIMSLALGAVVLVLAGCGAKNTTTNAPMQKTTPVPAEKSAVSAPAVETPAPTGKVDATVDAIIGGANSEKSQATSDETDVKTITDDSADSNNLSNTYDQTNL